MSIVGITLFGLFVAVNLFILLSGRFYLYKGIANTYLIGKTGPGIYDLNVFPKRTIPASPTSAEWIMHKKYNSFKRSKKDKRVMRAHGTTAFLVFKDEQLLYEKYYGTHDELTVSNSFSAAKTVVSLLVGIAIKEGYIKSIDEPVGNYLPSYASEDKKHLTIRHMLYMASGLNWGESGANPLSHNAESYYGTNLRDLIDRLKVVDEPGKTFLYQSGNSQILGFVVEAATGTRISDFAAEHLWKPLQAESDAHWSLDAPNGNEKAFCCWYSTARDFGRLGQLFVNRGKWNETQIIPEDYYQEMVKPAPLITEEGNKNTRYGLHVWMYPDPEWKTPVVYCRGILGQYVVAIPEKNLVFVRLGHSRLDNLTQEDIDKNPSKYTVDMIEHPADFFDLLALAKKIHQSVE